MNKEEFVKLKQQSLQFRVERDAALLSMDEERIRAFARKWNQAELPRHPIAFWGAVHKTITGVADLPREFRMKSKQWLDKHGFGSYDDGDLR